jgi:hypothetical protein
VKVNAEVLVQVNGRLGCIYAAKRHLNVVPVIPFFGDQEISESEIHDIKFSIVGYKSGVHVLLLYSLTDLV